MRTFSLLFAVAALSACGISDSTELSSLDDDGLTSLCEEFTEERSVTCEDGDSSVTIELGGNECDLDDANIPESCTVTAGDYRSCYGAYESYSDEEICESEGVPSECDALFTKLFSAECLVSTEE